MKISYQATYFLLEKYFARVSSIDEFLEDHVSSDIFSASVLFAKEQEDYRYLSTMISGKSESDNFVFFTNFKSDHPPIVIEKDKDLSLLEFALLQNKCGIHIEEFKSVVESTSENNGLKKEEVDIMVARFVAISEMSVKNEK
jgi:hypothetical protein